MHVLVEGARPRTLPAAVAPVLVGTALAASPHALRAGLALLTALALQVAVNYANDYFDGVGGIDTEERTGPRRMVASGLVEPSKMKHAIAGALLVAAVSGAVLAALAGWQLLLVGAVAMLAALGYSGGSKPYASMGLGELFVFVFFGLVATAGTTYVQDERLAVAPVIAGIAMGALATALLVVNNLRDIPTDEATGKRTLAVRIGERDTRRLYAALVATAFGSLAALVVVTGAVSILLAALSLVLLVPAARMVRRTPLGPQLVDALERTAKGQLVFGVLLTAGLLLDRAVA
ncbi:MAG: 1,4-dihydroxy-2-naphthoate octaprenyltransferase [Nitriliruptoraceae bacterium]|jgi:1,4-dihydroxy-2-naphthoate octaprenyltransferase